MPITFGSAQTERFLGLAQVLTDVSALSGRSITFERLVASSLVREDEDTTIEELPPPPSPPIAANEAWRSHPRAPHLRLVVSSNQVAPRDPLHFDPQDPLRKIFTLCGAGALQTTR